MSDATAKFFEEIVQRGHEPSLAHITGTLRFDLARGDDTDIWFVDIDKGHIGVSKRRGRADGVVTTDGRLFDAIVGGKKNAMTALLRGNVDIEGSLSLLLVFERLFPAPPRLAQKAVKTQKAATTRTAAKKRSAT